jgi:DNA repair protein RadC
MAEPNNAGKGITTRIKDALEVFDIDFLDQFVVTANECCSFANRGWL